MEFIFSDFFSQSIQITFISLLAFLFSLLLTWGIRVYAIRKSILDIPNERSSHQIPTPRGGGKAIVLTFTAFILWLTWINFIETSLAWTLIGGGIVIAGIGYVDDIYSIPARWRILVHFFAASWALYWLGGFPILDVGISKIPLHWMGSILALIGIVGCINFYNFMDGIDGLAGSEGIFVGLSSGIALWLLGIHHLAIVPWLLAASIGGFTFWNWPPAKIFLGDVGSGYLGFIFAILGLYTANKGFLPITFWWVILAVFLCDATFTLLYRIIQGKQWYSAHREHAYQRLISNGFSHKFTTSSILIINLCLLLPVAFAILYWPTKSLWLMGGSTLCLALIWTWIKSNFQTWYK